MGADDAFYRYILGIDDAESGPAVRNHDSSSLYFYILSVDHLDEAFHYCASCHINCFTGWYIQRVTRESMYARAEINQILIFYFLRFVLIYRIGKQMEIVENIAIHFYLFLMVEVL